ncbi:hypothetical protein [Actinoplanes sp. URMC 104]|uniref:hypothetical protein n=1 Tax=Actinoplanes sp. URMC 104 TaxID=3423409 RepID=UPI003F1B15CC
MNPLQSGELPPFDSGEYPVVPRPGTRQGTMLAPTWVEAAALRRGLSADGESRLTVRPVGPGYRRARRAALSPDVLESPVLAVAGFGQPLAPSLRPGDVVVAGEVRADALTEGRVPGTLRLRSATAVAEALRRRGLTVHVCAVVSTDRLSDPSARDRLTMTSAVVADLDSAWLLARRRGDRPAACVRVVAPPGITRRRAALRVLTTVAAGLEEWAASIA